jgi:hypothetical protein
MLSQSKGNASVSTAATATCNSIGVNGTDPNGVNSVSPMNKVL